MKDKWISFFSLFTSTGTLVCCALPALVAAIAGGAAVGSLVSALPWLVPLSKHKIWIFIMAAFFILLSGFLIFRPVKISKCDIRSGEQGCAVSEKFQKFIFYLSLSIFALGLFFSYALVPLLRWKDSLGGVS